MKAPDGDQSPGRRAGDEWTVVLVAGAEPAQVPRDVSLGDRVEDFEAATAEELRVPAEVAPVRGERVRREALLGAKVVEIAADRTGDLRGGVGQLSTSATSRCASSCASATGP